MWKLKSVKRTFGWGNVRQDDQPMESTGHKSIYKVIFALAIVLGVSPKKLASKVGSKKGQEFVFKFIEELRKDGDREVKKVLKKLNKV